MLQFTSSQRIQRPRCTPRSLPMLVSPHWIDTRLCSALIPLVTPQPPTAKGQPTPAHSARGPYHVLQMVLIFRGSGVMFNDPAITDTTCNAPTDPRPLTRPVDPSRLTDGVLTFRGSVVMFTDPVITT